MRVSLFMLICAGSIAIVGQLEAQEVRRQVQTVDLKLSATATMDTIGEDLAALDASHAQMVESAESLSSLFAQLSAGLENVAGRAGDLQRATRERTSTARPQSELLSAISEMSELQARLEMEMLALQNAMQMESRRYQTISNALKVRHDAAMASIRNMK